jgi:hypothetical protein
MAVTVSAAISLRLSRISLSGAQRFHKVSSAARKISDQSRRCATISLARTLLSALK